MTNIRLQNNTIKGNVISKKNVIKGNITNMPTATTEKKGLIRVATLEEAVEGIDNTTAITPYTLNKVTTYVHIQGEASALWVINHNLNKNPSISITDSAGTVVEGAENYIDENTIEIRFNSAFKGKAILN